MKFTVNPSRLHFLRLYIYINLPQISHVSYRNLPGAMLQTHVVDTHSTAAYTHMVCGDPVGPGDAAGPLPRGSVHGSGFAGSLQVGF